MSRQGLYEEWEQDSASDDYFEKKKDYGKLRYDLILPQFLEDLAAVLTFGCQKYGPNTWQEVDEAIQRYQAALMRHFEATRKGELIDAESGLPHHACIAANTMFLHYLQLLKEDA